MTSNCFRGVLNAYHHEALLFVARLFVLRRERPGEACATPTPTQERVSVAVSKQRRHSTACWGSFVLYLGSSTAALDYELYRAFFVWVSTRWKSCRVDVFRALKAFAICPHERVVALRGTKKGVEVTN